MVTRGFMMMFDFAKWVVLTFFAGFKSGFITTPLMDYGTMFVFMKLEPRFRAFLYNYVHPFIQRIWRKAPLTDEAK